MTTKHTKGQWVVDCDKSKDGSILIRDSQDWPIARIDCLKPSNPDLDHEGEANAQLIAAAPELLEVCKMATPIAETLMDELIGKKATNWGIVNDGLVKIKQAIYKAEGK